MFCKMSCYIVNITLPLVSHHVLFSDIYLILQVPCSLNLFLSLYMYKTTTADTSSFTATYHSHPSICRAIHNVNCLSVNYLFICMFPSFPSTSLSFCLVNCHQIMLVYIAKIITFEQVRLSLIPSLVSMYFIVLDFIQDKLWCIAKDNMNN